MPARIDLTGERFGNLVVIQDSGQRKNNYVIWECQCDCGKTAFVRSHNLRQGVKSCGCARQGIDLTWKTFGLLTVVSKNDKTAPNGEYYWNCICTCGKELRVRTYSLTSGRTQSCGCLNYSKGERILKKFLEDNRIPFLTQVPIYINGRNLFFDFAITNYEEEIIKFIEFDGIQHFKQTSRFGKLEDIQARDKEKDDYCNANSIPLIRIPYWEINQIKKEVFI